MSWDGRGDRPQFGSVIVTVAASLTGSQVVTFSPAFSAAPKITGLVTASTNAWFPSASAISASQFTVNVRRVDGGAATSGSITVHWRAEV